MCENLGQCDSQVAFVESFVEGRYLTPENRTHFEQFNTEGKEYPEQSKLILLQQIVTAVGYMVILVPTIPFVRVAIA